ncbi:MAG: hypothetical protein E7360_06875 [Clostridiales bacterium]|nr:hypothetical protein [Clostridiales bacterium]
MKKLNELLNGNLRDYRPVPFWSWNDELEPEELVRQIRDMKDKGIGGFFMHARGGLETEYLGDKWFECINACIEESKKVDMNAWSYDENGWPSGFAGMKLLEDPANHENYLGREVGEKFDEKADAVYFLDGTALKRVYEPCGEGTYVNVTVLTNPSVVDILDKNIVKKFIDLTHERYLKECANDFGTFMKGFFTDEPQYYRWDTAYSKVLIPYFKEKYGIELWDEIGKLFIDCDGAYAFRYKYWNALHKFFIESFAKQIYDWCEEHGCQLTGHGVEESAMYMQMWCCGGIMDFYEFEHMPGIDWLGRGIGSDLEPKQVGSASEQLGKKHVMTETFACCGWDVTPRELKRIAEWQYVSGVNLMCTHLASYSIRGQRKRDYPLHYSEHNSWHEEFRRFNDYFSRLGYILAESRNRVNTLIIHPMKTAYLDYDRRNDYFSVHELDQSFIDLIGEYGALSIPHHYGDENLMERHARVENGKMIVGNYSYEYVVLPWIKTIDKSTYALLKEFIKQGGKLIIEYGKPKYLEGEPYAFDDLVQTATREDLISSLEYTVETESKMVRTAYRTGEFGTFLYVVNLEEKDGVDCRIKLNSKYPVIYDLESMQTKPLKVDNGVIDLHLDFAGSVIIFESDEPYAPKTEYNGANIDLSGEWKVIESNDNSLTVDKARLSYDGVNYGEKVFIPALFNELIKKEYLGKIYLKYEFNVRDIPEKIYLECEQMSILNCSLNGNLLKFAQNGTLDKSFLTANIKDYVKVGLNEIVYEIDFYQSEHVYFVLADVTPEKESLKNCLSYDTELESIYIRGDFGVYDDTLKAIDNVYVTDGEPYVGKVKNTVNAESITTGGYLYFAGKMVLEKNIKIEKGASMLSLTGRYAVAEISVDGDEGQMLMFGTKADLSKYADGKEHTLRMTVYASNRNIYGPHHFIEYEPLSVSPFSFDFTGAWEEGYKCRSYRDNYSFVKFSIK